METALKLLGGIGISGLTLNNPLLGFYALIISLPFLPNEAALIFAAVVVFSYVIKIMTNKERDFAKDPIAMPLIAFALVQIITTIISVEPLLSAQNLLVSLVSIALYFVIVNTLKSKEDFDRAIKFFIITAFILSIYGIIQYFTLGTTSKAWVDMNLNPDVKTRVVGTFGNPNVFAEYLEHILPVAITLVFVYRKWMNKITMSLIAGTMFICLLMTFSRGAWLGFACAAMLFVILKMAKYIPLFIAGSIAAIPLLPQVVIQRISTIGNVQDTSNAYRTYIWEGTINMIKDFWVTGVGYGYWAFKNTFLEYGIKGSKAWHSHNMYLEIMAEMGIFGILTFAWVVLSIFVTTIKFSKKTKDRYFSYVSIGLLCGFLSIMVHGVAEHILYMPKSVILFWMFAAFISAARNLGTNIQQLQ
ncbi:O-antigen ligase family protein [Lutispora thermophila]|uniref:O-antigen ligase n=1 Tax=Lutispora thermophila DSM 19022 TaxID=1122184 RepID=A0A1M6FL35_9FIRM|nr:O-antigen ligase family protein [Lutispora thermophila]SHI98342.1 O-antigen ligase [Lutispora thermophila DSM 19022]